MCLYSVEKTLIKKAQKSICRYKISAIGFDKNGNILGSTFNRPRFFRKSGGIHAEIALLQKYKKKLKTIIICRVNNKGKLLQIKPCNNCKNIFKKLGIKVYTLNEK